MNKISRLLILPIATIMVLTLASCTNENTSLSNNQNKVTNITTDSEESTSNSQNKNNSQAAIEEFDYKSASAEIITAFISSDYETMQGHFSSKMKSVSSKEKMAELSKNFITGTGAFKKIQEYTTIPHDDFYVHQVTVDFENVVILFTLSYDKSNDLGGFFFKVAPEKISDSSSAPSDKFVENPIKIGTEKPLDGKITVPNGEGLFPAVILVHGSGPNDMDETLGKNKPFRDIAHELSKRGIAVIRYNKRNSTYSMPLKYTAQDLVIDDVVSAHKLLLSTSSIDQNRIFVLGHSIGGWFVPKIGEQLPTVGLISLAGPSRSFSDVIDDQINYLSTLDSNKNAQVQDAFNTLRTQAENMRNNTFSDNPAENMIMHPKEFWQDLHLYMAADYALKIDNPLLVLQGEMDYQVTMDDFNLWKETLKDREDTQFISYPNLTHLFMPSSSTGNLSTPADYATESTVSTDVIDDISDWIEQH